MRKSESKASFIFGAIPHSVLRRTKQIKNPTASALLLLLAERTFAFRKGFVDLSYQKIAQELDVTWRTIVSAAKRLQDQGDLVRKKLPGGAYRWWVPINRNEVLLDLDHRFCIRGENEDSVTPSPDRSIISPPDRSIRGPLIDRSGDRTFDREQSESISERVSTALKTVDKCSLKKVFKETDLKKQQQACSRLDGLSGLNDSESNPQIAAQSVDEPLYKICLKRLQSHGVSQRVSRLLCREYEHETIQLVLDRVPGMSGIQNLAGYLVSAIKDGGYEQTTSCPQGKKNAPQVTGRRSNYAHLTDHNVKSDRHRTVKPGFETPIAYRSVEATRKEAEEIAFQVAEREESYQEKSKTLAERFKTLSADVKGHLKTLSAAYLEEQLPMSGKRDEMLQDPALRRMANRTVLERFFDWVDQGGSQEQALGFC